METNKEDNIINKILNLFRIKECEHEIVWDKIKTMTYPEIHHGYCIKCHKQCIQEGDNEIIWKE